MYASENGEYDGYHHHAADLAEHLVDPSVLFPSAGSRDELTPRYVVICYINVHILMYVYRELEAATLSACRIHGTPPPASLVLNGGGTLPGAGELSAELGSVAGAGAGAATLLEEQLCHGLHHLSWHHCPEVHKAIDGVRFIADHTKREEDSTRVTTTTTTTTHTLHTVHNYVHVIQLALLQIYKFTR